MDRTLPREHPLAPQVHHLRGKAAGDDPKDMIAAHRDCNLKIGDPSRLGDPPHKPVTQW
jgi:hypothetical protein